MLSKHSKKVSRKKFQSKFGRRELYLNSPIPGHPGRATPATPGHLRQLSYFIWTPIHVIFTMNSIVELLKAPLLGNIRMSSNSMRTSSSFQNLVKHTLGKFTIYFLKYIRGHPYTTWSNRGMGLYEMTMNDHEEGGFPKWPHGHVDRDVFAYDQKMVMWNSPYELLHE